MFFDRGFATVAEVKSRMGIVDSTDDAIITEIVRSTAGTIENLAGRPLLRRHALVETLSGGERTIRLRSSPIVQVHIVRESATRDFDDSDNYTELVEGTGYILEAGAGGRPGSDGVLRRLGRNWLGNEQDNAGQIQVTYTGGYKTDDEIALEDSTLTLNSVTDTLDYNIVHDEGIDYQLTGLTDTTILASRTVFDTILRAFLRFTLQDVFMPTWNISTFEVSLFATAASGTNLRVYVLSVDAARNSATNLVNLWADMNTAGSALQLGATTSVDPGPVEYTFALSNTTGLVAMETLILAAVNTGQLSVGVRLNDEETQSSVIITSSEGTSGQTPKLTILHHRLLDDPHTVPGDLRHANVLQASYEFQQRRTVGVRFSSQRGVAVASGAAVSKNPTEILPEVEVIAKRYRRLF